ncbi:hypothetical protein [Dechloromonas sp.]|uniref:hypothetical protein n=1 Tax=Dechloromonas sp. TaxID=1917218 RepID=UPI00216DE507|nr:hypothetical protein [Dechloromonas sp.]MBU3697501.1 hypothetical protein [Dechloromonas sp.]
MAIVNVVLGDCPGCGGKACFGNVMITGNKLSRGCKQCRYWTYVNLPPVSKKIVYLDQSILSAAFKGGDARAVQAVERVSQLASKQLLVAPHSNLHEDETHQWAGYGGKTPVELMKFIERTARGLEFKNSYSVEEAQAYKGFKAFLAGASPQYELDEKDAVSGDIHEWHNYVYITVGRYLGDTQLISELKEQAVRTLLEVFDTWAQSTNSFEQDVALENAEAGKGYLQAFLNMQARLERGDFDALLNAPIASQCVGTLLHAVRKDMPTDEAFAEVVRFFFSEHFAELPCQWLSSRMFATIKSMVKNGAFSNREKALSSLSGVFYDVQHISTYAPYCDAIFILKTAVTRYRLHDLFASGGFSVVRWPRWCA